MASPLSPLAAMASAVTSGIADFTGGRAGRRTSATSVAAGTELIGLAVLPLAIVMLPIGWDPHAALLALVGGAAGGLGLVAFYRAMSLHKIGVIAPIAGFVGAALPTAVGLISGERLGIWQLGGVVIGLGAIALINGAGRTTGTTSRSGILLAVLAGIAFGVFFVLLHAASGSGVTAFASARIGSSLAVCAAAVVGRSPLRVRRSAWRLVVIGGVIDAIGSICYLYASHGGMLAITALLTSFYPGFTVLCARLFTHERLTRFQSLGAAMAVAAIAMIAIA
jgi:drug/metabolite transporter (DMT)-like permease